MEHITYRDASAFPPDEYSKGLTKREYFAAQALSGLLANTNIDCTHADLTEIAIDQADALIKALNK